MPAKKSSPKGKYHHGDVRKALTQAALELAQEVGIAGLSLREVARRVGVSTAAPYFHFPDRQSLLIEIAIDGYVKLLRQLQQSQQPGASPEQQVALAVAAYLRFSKTHCAHYAIMFSGQFSGHARFEEMMQVAQQSLGLVGQSIAQATGYDAATTGKAVFCAWSLLHGIAMLDLNRVLMEDPQEQEELAVRGVLSMIRGFEG